MLTFVVVVAIVAVFVMVRWIRRRPCLSESCGFAYVMILCTALIWHDHQFDTRPPLQTLRTIGVIVLAGLAQLSVIGGHCAKSHQHHAGLRS